MTTASPPLPAPSLDETTTSRRLPPTLRPAMPRLAEMAANDLARPMRHCHDGLRALDQWFTQNGDPFAPLEAGEFTQIARERLDQLEHEYAHLSNAELFARLSAAFGVLKTRFDTALREGQS